ncbi:MAG: ATP-binding protein [Candidatus Dormibacter sp.]
MRELVRRTRVRLTLTYSAAVTVALGVGGILFFVVFSQASLGTIDSGLRGQAQILSSSLGLSGGSIIFKGGDTLPSETPEGEPISALVLSADGATLDQAGQPIDAGLARTLAVQDRGLDAQPVIDSRFIGAMHQRLLVQALDVGGQNLTLVLSRSLEEYDKTTRLTIALIGATVALLALAAAASAYRLAGRVLRPVRIITATARDLGENSLDRRITLDLPRDEIGMLATTFNEMLDRIEAAFAALRRFTADAAHELRSPLTALRAEVEVVMRRPRDSSDYRATLAVVLGEIERLSGVTDQLLLLARVDAGTLVPRREGIDVSDLLEEVGERWRSLASRSNVAISVRAPGEGTIEADPVLLRRVLDNLLDNAIRHTPPGGRVNLTADHEKANWMLAVEDSGPGVEPAVRPFLFERAHPTADSHRSGSAGLGLSLCAAIATAHGGHIHLDADKHRGARFVVTLPVEPAGRDPDLAGPP